MSKDDMRELLQAASETFIFLTAPFWGIPVLFIWATAGLLGAGRQFSREWELLCVRLMNEGNEG